MTHRHRLQQMFRFKAEGDVLPPLPLAGDLVQSTTSPLVTVSPPMSELPPFSRPCRSVPCGPRHGASTPSLSPPPPNGKQTLPDLRESVRIL